MGTDNSNRLDFKTTFKQLPLVIKILFWYSVIFGIASLLYLLPTVRHWYKAVIPYPGWRPNTSYLSIVIIIYFWTLSGIILSKLDTMRKYLVSFLGIILFMGIIDWISEDSNDYYFSNPYFTYNSLHVTFGISVPLLFLLMIRLAIAEKHIPKEIKCYGLNTEINSQHYISPHVRNAIRLQSGKMGNVRFVQ